MPEQTDINPENKPTAKKRRRLPRITRKGAVIAGVGLVIIAALVFAGSKIIEKDPNHLGKVGDHIVTKDEVQALEQGVGQAGFYPEDEEQLLTLAMNYHFYTTLAKEYELEVSEEEALNHLKARISHIKPSPNLDMGNQYVKYRAYGDILSTKLPLLMQSQHSGRFIVAHFDKNFDKSLSKLRDLTEEQHEALMAQDRQYATDFINKAYADIKSGKITFDQAMARQRKDPKLGEKALPTSYHSEAFNKPNEDAVYRGVTITNNPEIYEKIKGLNAGDMTEPFILKAQQNAAPDAPLVESSWMIVRIDKTNGTNGLQFGSSLEGLQHFKQKLGYEIYK